MVLSPAAGDHSGQISDGEDAQPDKEMGFERAGELEIEESNYTLSDEVTEKSPFSKKKICFVKNLNIIPIGINRNQILMPSTL